MGLKITVVTGSRADWGPLEAVVMALQADPYFEVRVVRIWNATAPGALALMLEECEENKGDLLMLLGDRYEILQAAIAAHLNRVPIAHIGGGDVSEGSYDDAMRDCISRMASIHFATSSSAAGRLSAVGYGNVHMVGSPGIDYIRHAPWRKERPIQWPYVVVDYQVETIDGHTDLTAVIDAIGDRRAVWIKPNDDHGSHQLRLDILEAASGKHWLVGQEFEHGEFLNLIYHAHEFIGNSSAMLYEAPELGVKTHMIGKRQRGRVVPEGDGHACERIIKVLKEWPAS